MTPDELRPILQGYRKQVEQGWSKATAHPSFEGADGSPVGQCGVTSAWLQKRLREDHGVETTYVEGDLIRRMGQPLRDHCWLELSDGVDRTIIDLTVDQIDDSAPFMGTHWDLLLNGIGHYIAHRRRVPVGPILDRLALLEAALS